MTMIIMNINDRCIVWQWQCSSINDNDNNNVMIMKSNVVMMIIW